MCAIKKYVHCLNFVPRLEPHPKLQGRLPNPSLTAQPSLSSLRFASLFPATLNMTLRFHLVYKCDFIDLFLCTTITFLLLL